MILYLPDSSEPFNGECDGNKDCTAEDDVVNGVEEVAEGVRV